MHFASPGLTYDLSYVEFCCKKLGILAVEQIVYSSISRRNTC